MSLSFTLARTEPPAPVRRKVLVTGAAGKIGSYFAEHAHERYDLRLMVHHADEAGEIKRFGEVVTGTLDDLEKLKQFCAGIDTVLHLAANASPSAAWDSILPDNIVGTYNLFAAARIAGCRRVIYASSIHAVSGYAADVQVKTTDPVNPGDLYGVSKCFGEALGRYMAEQEGLSTICLRIGGFQPMSTARDQEKGIEMFDAFVSRRDLQQLIERCIDDARLQFGIFHGLSDNRFKRLDISDARELVGYAPVDDTTREQPGVKGLRLRERVSSHSMVDAGEQSGLRRETGKARPERVAPARRKSPGRK